MGTKRTKKEEETKPAAAPVAKAAPKRKVGVRPPAEKAAAPVAAPKAKAKAPEPKAEPVAKTTKAPAKKAATKPAAAPATVPAAEEAAPKIVELSTETIALRAYFISEARQTAGLPGDSTTDWLEAERQLRAELA